MNQLLVVGVLQGIGYLLDVVDDGRKRQGAASGVMLAQCAAHGVIHDQEGSVILHVEVEHTYNIGMFEMGDGLGFEKEACCLIWAAEPGLVDFNGGPGTQA